MKDYNISIFYCMYKKSLLSFFILILVNVGCESLQHVNLPGLTTPATNPSQASTLIVETESYRMALNSVKKTGNTITMVLTFENLTEKILHIEMDRGRTHLLDDIGEKWNITVGDVTGIFGCCAIDGIDLAVKTKRKTTIIFETQESGKGNVFTLVLHEFLPQSRIHNLHDIKA